MENQRPDPDALLRRVQAEEAEQVRGKLKVFSARLQGLGRPMPCCKRHMSSNATASM